MKFMLLLSLALCSYAPTAQAQSYLELAGLNPGTHYQTFETTHFQIVYQDGFAAFAERVATHIEHAHTILSPLLKWQPRQKTVVLIADNDDSANGFTMPALRVGIVLIATPPDTSFSTQYTDDWIKLLVFHEYTHWLNIDATTEWMEVLRYVFGDIIRPNGLWPVWMLEGLAVYFETRTSILGRGRSPYYDSILRANVNEKRFNTQERFGFLLDRVNGDDPFFPGGEIPYLFGYHLWNQFAKERSDLDMGEYSIRSSHRVPYFIEGNLENLTGKNWIHYWDAFAKSTEARLQPQIEKVKAKGETPIEWITHSNYSALGAALTSDGTLLAFNQVTLQERQGLYLKDLKTGKEEWIHDTLGGVGMAFTKDARYLIFSSLTRHKTYSVYSDIYAYDLKKKKLTQITYGIRAKDPTLSPDGTHLAFIQTISASNVLSTAKIEFDQDGEVKLSYIQTLDASSPFSILGNPKFLNDQEVIYSSQEIGKPYSDLKFIQLGEKKPRVLYHDGSMIRFPFVHDKKIDFVSDLSGIENIYELQNNKAVPITNVITGVIAPFAAQDSTLFASVMTSNGYEIAKLQTKSLVASPEKMAEPSAPVSIPLALNSPKIQSGPTRNYAPWNSLAPRQWSPFVYAMSGSDSGLTLGGEVLGFDSTGTHEYLGLGAYNFKSKTMDAYLQYTFYAFRPAITLSASAATSDIGTDLNHALFRREYETRLSFAYPILWTYSSLRPSVYAFTDWNGIYDLNTRQRQSTNDFEFGKPNVPGFGASVTWTDAENSKLGFMNERGTSVTLAAEDRINLNEFSLWKYLASVTHYFKVGNHSVFQPQYKTLGSSQPTGYDRSYALLNGKSSNSISDRGTSLSLSGIGLRGYFQNETLRARSVHVGSLNYHFPLQEIFTGVSDTGPLFLKQIHGFVFSDFAYIPSARFKNLYLPSFGGGVSLDTTLLIRAPITVNLEYQNGTRKDFGGDSLYFLSLQSAALF